MREKLIKAFQKPVTSIAISLIVGFLVGALVLLAAGFNPVQGYAALFSGMFSKPKYVSQIIINAAPIMLTGLSVAFAFKAGLFNIGAEGQYMMGALTAGILGYFVALPAGIHPIFVLIFCFIAGGLFGGLAGWLKSRFGIHEVISTIMLNWIALYFNNYIINLPSVKKEGSQASNAVLESARIQILGNWKKSDAGKEFIQNNEFWGDIIKTDLHWGILLAFVMIFVMWYFLMRTTKGYELRAVGASAPAAEFAGINIKKNTVLTMFLAGGVAALGGAVMVLGTGSFRVSILAAAEGYGWDGISVALIAMNNPIGCIFSGLLFAGLKFGGSTLQQQVGAPSEVINIMIGTIVFCVALGSVFPMIADRLKKGAKHSG